MANITGRRILIVSQWFVSEDLNGRIYIPGGNERTSYELAKQLKRKGYEIMILSTTENKNVGYKILDGIKVYRFKQPRRFYGFVIDFLSFLNTWKVIKRFNPDIVHIIGDIYRFSIGAIIASKIMRKKVLKTVTNRPKKRKRLLARLFDNLIASKIIKMVDIITYSTPDLQEILSYIRNDAIFIPNFVDSSRFKPAKAINGLNSTPKILITSTFSYNKGGRVALKAMKIVKEEYPDIEIAALKPKIDHIYQAILLEEIERENIKVLPPIPDNLMPDILNYYDIIVGQFYIGALGRLELEAMACGKPLICFFKYWNWYDSPPPIISATSPDNIAKNIKKLITYKDIREKIGTENRKWVVRNHDLKVIVQKYVQIYEKLCK